MRHGAEQCARSASLVSGVWARWTHLTFEGQGARVQCREQTRAWQSTV